MMWLRRLLFLLVFYLPGISSASGADPALFDPWRKSPSDAPTINEFIATCDGDVFQCEYKMRNAVLNNINKKDAQSICIKDDDPRNQVINWLKAHPETHTMPTEDGLYTAYKSLYRCP